MTIDQYRGLLRERGEARARWAELAADVAATLSLSAPGAAPVGIGSTGEPACTVHTSYLGIPAISLPLFRDEGLPLGLQVAGFADRDAATFATAAWIEEQCRVG
jgi:Asp-tRNA(Asn)/Glu-tRNA(Gln) amidotransferase A subunit family amidase